MALFDYMALGLIHWLNQTGKAERRRMELEAEQDALDELEEEEEEREEEEWDALLDEEDDEDDD